MKLKERIRKFNTFLKIEEKLNQKQTELVSMDDALTNKKKELESVQKRIDEKKKELETLKIEAVELRDFINSNFKEEFKDYNYKVDITHCYIIRIDGKKYIALRSCMKTRSDLYSRATGFYNVELYQYYDALSLDEEGKYKYFYTYKHGYFDNNYYGHDDVIGRKHDYEEHILEAYPELRFFTDNYVPNTYLKKIYYEINDLGNKKLIKTNLNQ